MHNVYRCDTSVMQLACPQGKHRCNDYDTGHKYIKKICNAK